jgi:hypothetical protein
LKAAMEELLPPQFFRRWSAHGNSDWTPQKLAWMAILMSWDEACTLGERFAHTRRLLKALQPRWKLPMSYSGFVAAFEQYTPTLRAALVERLRPGERQTRCWRVAGWLAMAIDGSRFEAPRTVVNERRLGCAGKERSGPQVFQTTVQHVGTGLPWDFRLGPDSERRHLDDMLAGLPSQVLLLADAGFVSYELCAWLTSQRQAFLMRVGGNRHAPRERSGAQSRTIIRRVLRQALDPGPQSEGTPLKVQLARAVKDRYRRRGPKQTRDWPRKKEQRPPKPPKLQEATESERQRAQHLWHATPLRL